MVARDAREHWLQKGSGWDRTAAERDLAELRRAHALHIALQALGLREHALRALDDELSICRRRDATLAAREELDTQLLLQRLDATAESGLAEVNDLRGPREAGVGGERHNVFESPKVHL